MVANAKLAIVDVTWNAGDQPKPGTPITFVVTVKNTGPEVLPADVKQTTVKIFIDREELPEIKYNGEIALGETKVFESVVWEATPGNHVITATVDFAVPSPDNFGMGVTFTKNMRVAEEALPIPAPAAEKGMTTLTFSDDFASLDTIDVGATGNIGYKWYPTRPYGEPTLEPDDYEITENGILLKHKVNTFNYGLGMLDIRTGAGWGYTHGYMEMRVRTPADRISGDRGKPSVWSLPPEKILSYPDANRYVEMDFLEFLDDDSFTTTLHDLSFTDANQNEYIHHYKNQNYKHLGMRDGEWHTMGFVWRDGSIIGYLDGKEYMTLCWQDNGTSYPEAMSMKGNTDGLDAFAIFDDLLTPLVII